MKAILLDEAKKWLEENCENLYTRMAVFGLMQSMPTVDYQEEPNEPLTLEELREMRGQPFWDDAGSVWWIVAHVDGSKIYTEEGAILDFYEEGKEDIYFRRRPEVEEEI